MDFSLTEEQRLLVGSIRTFVEQELYPYESEIEKENLVSVELAKQIRDKAISLGFYAANMPGDIGGGGLDAISLVLFERELGRAAFALQYLVARPSNILQACVGEQREQYLLPCVRGEKIDCLAMTEPEAGSDLRSMSCTAKRSGSNFIINGTKHFISHADIADFVILFASTGEEKSSRGRRMKISAFLIDMDTPGLSVRPGYRSVSHSGYHNCILEFFDCRISEGQLLGGENEGFEMANEWLGNTRLQVASMCLGRAHRALELASDWAASRKQFGQTIGRFQGVGFKLSEMKVRLEAAELLTLQTAWKAEKGIATDSDYAAAKLYSTEMLALVSDEAIQIHGGMGLMVDLPLERIWRDARVERIWEGTSEIQRHIIAKNLLRPYWQ